MRLLLNSFVPCSNFLGLSCLCKCKWQRMSQFAKHHQRRSILLILAPCKCFSRPNVVPLQQKVKLPPVSLLRSALMYKISAQCNGCSIQWIQELLKWCLSKQQNKNNPPKLHHCWRSYARRQPHKLHHLKLPHHLTWLISARCKWCLLQTIWTCLIEHLPLLQ